MGKTYDEKHYLKIFKFGAFFTRLFGVIGVLLMVGSFIAFINGLVALRHGIMLDLSSARVFYIYLSDYNLIGEITGSISYARLLFFTSLNGMAYGILIFFVTNKGIILLNHIRSEKALENYDDILLISYAMMGGGLIITVIEHLINSNIATYITSHDINVQFSLWHPYTMMGLLIFFMTKVFAYLEYSKKTA